MIYNKFLLLKFLGSIGLTGLSEISFSTMAWSLGIRGEKIEENRGWRWVKEKREKLGDFFYIIWWWSCNIKL